MPRFKDLPKTHAYIVDSELQSALTSVEQELKGSVGIVGGPIQAEPAIMERPPEVIISDELSNLKAGLLEVKADLNHIKELIDKMDRNGLKMKTQW